MKLHSIAWLSRESLLWFRTVHLSYLATSWTTLFRTFAWASWFLSLFIFMLYSVLCVRFNNKNRIHYPLYILWIPYVWMVYNYKINVVSNQSQNWMNGIVYIQCDTNCMFGELTKYGLLVLWDTESISWRQKYVHLCEPRLDVLVSNCAVT